MQKRDNMKINPMEWVSQNKNMEITQKSENTYLYTMKSGSGTGNMLRQILFPGIDVMYNDFNMLKCISDFRPEARIIGIDHCMEGRIEWQNIDGTYMYIQQGDLQINNKEHHSIGFGFPLGYYRGITIAIYLDEISDELKKLFREFSIDLKIINEKFCSSQSPFMIRKNNSIEQIFKELYENNKHEKMSYCKIKILELLLFLTITDPSKYNRPVKYFNKSQVETVKNIMKYISTNLETHFTLEELSSMFEIPLTSMKSCFKEVYGDSIYTYLKNLRMKKAAGLLIKTDKSITSISSITGYTNTSKFSAAFKKIYGLTPSKYRKTNR